MHMLACVVLCIETHLIHQALYRINAITAVKEACVIKCEFMKSMIGVYEGAGYQSKGVYRPFPDCRMKTNAADAFCPVCQRALERMIEFYTVDRP